MTPEAIKFENRKYSSSVLRLVPLDDGLYALADHKYRWMVNGTLEELLPHIRAHQPEPYIPYQPPKADLDDLEIDLSGL